MTVLFGCLIGGYTLVESLGAENRPHPEDREERSGPTWPNQNPTGVKLGRPWPLALSWAKQVTCAQLGPNLRQTRASWLQLGPTLSPTGSNMAQLGNVWAQVGLSMRNLACVWRRSWAQDKPNVGNTASHQQSQKNVGSRGNNARFQRVASRPQNRLGSGPAWPRGASKPGPTGAQVGAKWSCWAEVRPKAIQMDSKLKPPQVSSNMLQLGIF